MCMADKRRHEKAMEDTRKTLCVQTRNRCPCAVTLGRICQTDTMADIRVRLVYAEDAPTRVSLRRSEDLLLQRRRCQSYSRLKLQSEKRTPLSTWETLGESFLRTHPFLSRTLQCHKSLMYVLRQPLRLTTTAVSRARPNVRITGPR